MRKYRNEILSICDTMLFVKKEITPILSDVLIEVIKVAENSGVLINPRSFTMFMSYGTSYL